MSKINLSLLKDCIAAVESSLSIADDLTDSVTEQGKNVSIIELSKAAGILAGMMQESSLLILDIQSVVQLLQMPKPPMENLINKTATPNKGSAGNTGNMN